MKLLHISLFKKRLVVTGIFVLAVALMLSIAFTHIVPHLLAAPNTETVTAPFTNGPNGVTTANSYAGSVTINVSGTGQASASAYSDAFYIYTDNSGNPITPEHHSDFGLCINSQPVDNYVSAIPSYSSNHTYQFTISVNGSPQRLTFGVCDTFTSDNTGSFSITVSGSSPTPTQTVTPNPSPSPSPNPTRGKLVVLLQGITSSLTQDQINGTKDGQFGDFNKILESILGTNGFANARVLFYSYKTSTLNGAYRCQDTAESNLAHYVTLLNTQISNALSNNANTDIYLIGHSQGGAIAFGYLAYLKTLGALNGSIPKFPNAKLKGVVTLDSPIGGIPDGRYLSEGIKHYQDKKVCPALKGHVLNSLNDLVSIFKTVKHPPADPQGGNASMIKILFPKFRPTATVTNQQLAEEAAKNGVPVLTVENEIDFLFDPSDCIPFIGGSFVSTQKIADEGDNSGIYGRFFVAGDPSCVTVFDTGDNHFKVLLDDDVLMALSQFLSGMTPSKLSRTLI